MAGAPGWPVFPVRILVEDAKGVRRLEYSGHRPLWIGSDVGCDIALVAPRVTGRHASVGFEGGKLILRDAESQHGTVLNGARVGNAELQEGDVIRIGGARLVVQRKVVEAESEDGAREGGAEEGEREAVGSEGSSGGERGPSRRGRIRPRARMRGAARVSGRVSAPAGSQDQRQSQRQVLKTALAVVLLLGVGVAAAFLLVPGLLGRTGAGVATPAGPDAAIGAVPAGGDGTVADPLAGGDSSAPPPGTPRIIEKAPDEILVDIQRAAERGELGWEVLEQLRSFLKTYPDHDSRAEVEKRVAILSGTRAGAERAEQAQAARAVDKMFAEGRHGEAAAAARFLAGAGGEETRAHWEKRAKEIEAAAQTRFRALEEELNGLISAGKSGDALRALLAARRQFSSMKFFDTLLENRVEAALSPVRKPAESTVSPEALQLRDKVGLAFDECDFRKGAAVLQSILALELPPEERLRALEGLIEMHHLDRMFDDLLAFVSRSPVEAASLDGYPGRIVRADRKEYEYELDIDGKRSAVRRKQPWTRLSPASKLAVFESVPAPSMTREGFLGLAALAFRAGDEEGGQRSLLRLFKRNDSQDIVNAVLARHLGIPVPKGGFVEMEGKLVTPAAKAAELERRKQAGEEDRLARAELLKVKKEDRIASFITQAKRLRQQGSFTIAQALLAEVAKRFSSSAPGKEARNLLDDPILAVHTLQNTGPAQNRLDFYFLGDGYPAEDGYQSAFLVSANVAMKLVLKEEPFKEYASYLNFHAVQLASRDRGLDRLPGGEDKDTPVGGKVEYDRFTSDRSKAMAILQRAGKGTADGQAIVIGNDYAGVSTGGGGVSNVCKASLNALAHEIGHALGGLRDEYDFEPGNDPNKKAVAKRDPNVPVSPMPPNLMAGSDREEVLKSVIWKDWLEAGPDRWWNGSKVSAFEGGDRQPFNVWRPQSSCKMRDSTAFCVVCMELMVKQLYRRVRPIDRADPGEKEILLPNGEEREVKIWPMRPATHLLEVKWLLQQLPDEETKGGPTIVVEKFKEDLHRSFGRREEPDGRVVEFAILRARDFKKGKRFRLRVEVRDTTQWVLKDAEGLLKEEREWLVRIGGK